MTLFLASTSHQPSSLLLPCRIFCSCSLIVSVMPLPWFLVCSRRLEGSSVGKPNHHHHLPSSTNNFFIQLSSPSFVSHLSSQPHLFSTTAYLPNHQPLPIHVSSHRFRLHPVFISTKLSSLTQLHHNVNSVLTVGGRWPWWAARQICHWTRPPGQLL